MSTRYQEAPLSAEGQPVYLSLDELAALLKRSPTTILNDRVRNPGAVPPAIRLPGTRHLLWEQSTVCAWLSRFTEGEDRERTAALAPAEAPRRRARSRKQG